MATCKTCEGEVLHVRDAFTGASFPVDAEPVTVRGFRLSAPAEGARTLQAELVDVEIHRPHSATCSAQLRKKEAAEAAAAEARAREEAEARPPGEGFRPDEEEEGGLEE